MTSPVSLSSALTSPTASTFSTTLNIGEEANAGAALVLSSLIVTVASDGFPFVTPAGSVPKESLTLSPSSSAVSSVALSVKLFSVSVAPKVTFPGTPDQSSPVSPCAVAPSPPSAVTGTVTSRPGAPSSRTATATVPPSSTE